MVASSATMRRTDYPWRLGELVQQHHRHRGDLGQGVGLAKDAGVELPPAHRRVRMAETSRMPTSRPKTSTVTRVGIRPLCISTRNSVLSSSLSATGSRYWPSMVRCFKPPRQQAVERVGQARGQKENKAELKPVLKNGRHQERRQADAQQREQIGSGAERIQSGLRDVCHGRFNADNSLQRQPKSRATCKDRTQAKRPSERSAFKQHCCRNAATQIFASGRTPSDNDGTAWRDGRHSLIFSRRARC